MGVLPTKRLFTENKCVVLVHKNILSPLMFYDGKWKKIHERGEVRLLMDNAFNFAIFNPPLTLHLEGKTSLRYKKKIS